MELGGPFSFGGGGWSLSDTRRGGRQGHHPEPTLLLFAGGTGVTGWLPALAANGRAAHRTHLVWCVRDKADYLALASRLPISTTEVSVYVTRARDTARDTARVEPMRISAGSAPSEAGGATDRPPPRGASSLLTAVSLAVTLVGLAVGYTGWNYLVELLGVPRLPVEAGWLHETIAGYTLSRRCLPIMLIVAALLLTTAGGLRLVSGCAARARRTSRRCCPNEVELGGAVGELGAVSPHGPQHGPQHSPHAPQEPLFTGVSSTTRGPALQDGGATAAAGAAAAVGHHVRSGRPDLVALVRAAAAGLDSETQSRRLVVAACGPAVLVEAARKAVVAVRKEHRGLRLEFSGSDSRW